MADQGLHIVGESILDRAEREVYFYGINLSGDAKIPHIIHGATFASGVDQVTFVDRPFPLNDASSHLGRLRALGFNALRLLCTWEALEHEGPGIYDDAYTQYIIGLIRAAKEMRMFVFVNAHQDAWSRSTGGSGAPEWTLHACGLNPDAILSTQAALSQSMGSPSGELDKSSWAANYSRLACLVLFTFFFSGKTFLPKCRIDNMNIQDYLQYRFIAAFKYLATRIREAGDLSNVVGWETINEPSAGLIGAQDLRQMSRLALRDGPSPTPWQAILTGAGRSCEVDIWRLGRLGPRKDGQREINPERRSVWLPHHFDDSRYGWKRSSEWKLGSCPLAQHGVWDFTANRLLQPDYFCLSQNRSFGEDFLVPHWREYTRAIRDVFPAAFILIQPSMTHRLPDMRKLPEFTENGIYAPHFYDGLALITGLSDPRVNIDSYGIIQNHYKWPWQGLKLGESAGRRCFRNQLMAIKQEGLKYMGKRPCILTETGINFNMNHGKAFATGDFTRQTQLMDAMLSAVDDCAYTGFCLWHYSTQNTNQGGDGWNGEDFSICSHDPVPCVDNGGFRAVAAYIKPHPICVVGHLRAHAFHLSQGRFAMTLLPTRSSTEETPTMIFLPSSIIGPARWQIEVSAGKYNQQQPQILSWIYDQNSQPITMVAQLLK